MSTYQVVDLFAGPGGLAEGFSSFVGGDGNKPFQVTLSVEKEASAHRTLQLRAFLRQFEEFPEEYYDALNNEQPLPDWSKTHEGEWETALEEALRLELGTPQAARILDERIAELVQLGVPTVVIGGPPCQAYSLVGRSRNQGTEGYVPEDDNRHFLYREYIRILKGLRPVAFVMENVKGILSSSVEGRRIFEQVLADLRAADGSPESYDLFAVALDDEGRAVLRKTLSPRDFIVRSEDFGVPQARHRVIVVGLRRDVAKKVMSVKDTTGRSAGEPATVRDAISGLPVLRSGLSRGDDAAAWRDVVTNQMDTVIAALELSSDTASDLLISARKSRAAFKAANAFTL